RKTTKLPILQSLCSAVALSICLTRLVKGSLTSRAKIIATGLPPFFQTKHNFLPAVGPLTCNGLKGVILELPTCGPDFRSSPAQTPLAASARQRLAPIAFRMLIVEPTSLCENRDLGSKPIF